MTDGPEKAKVIEAPTRRSQRYEPPRARASPRVPHANEEPGASSGTTVAARKLAVVLVIFSQVVYGFHVNSGMETLLFSCLILLAVCSYVQDTRMPAGGRTIALAYGMRPDAVRQVVKRTRDRLRALASDDVRFAPLDELALLG